MFCGNCGKKIPEGSKFCKYCGFKVCNNKTTGGFDSDYIYNSEKQKTQKLFGQRKHVKIIVGCLAVTLCLLLIGVLYATIGLDIQKNRLISVIDASEISEYIDRKNTAIRDWKQLKITDLYVKNDVLNELKTIYEKIKVFEQCADEIEHLQTEKERFHIEDDSYENYVEILDKCTQAVKRKEAEYAVSLLESAKASLDRLIGTNDSYIDNMLELYETADLSEAAESDRGAYQKHLEKIKELAKKDKKDYQAIKQEISQVDETIYMYIQPENLLSISVQQIDVTEFPKTKLYLNIKDAINGDVPENLDNTMFYIKKEDTNSQYVKQVISNVNQLNELEALKIDMVADVSGSMSGPPLIEAKNIMSNFVNSVQFSAGDMVELTSFATGVRLEQEFCGDAGLLTSKINNFYTGNMTSLYDALYTSVERIASQSGAKCVIAFTDGNDNYSNCTKEDVINIAQRYHIPIFIIGIGSSDYSDVSYIAQQTGGLYYGVNDVFSMENIYSEIYRMEKELFLIEFEDQTGASLTDTSNIEIAYHSRKYGGECKYTYTPNIMLSTKGADVYHNGPEAVIEKYLKSFDKAVTNSDFSYISQYLKPGSAIYNEQQQYIMKDISEQLDSFEIVSIDYSDMKNCIVTTIETYFVQIENNPLQLMTQECRYAMEENNGEWKMIAFADQVEVLSRINQ